MIYISSDLSTVSGLEKILKVLGYMPTVEASPQGFILRVRKERPKSDPH